MQKYDNRGGQHGLTQVFTELQNINYWCRELSDFENFKMTNKEKIEKLYEIADALKEWCKYSEKVTNRIELDRPEAKKIIRRAMTLLVDNLGLFNECKNKYGIHNPLRQCVLQIEEAKSWQTIKDLGNCRAWTRDFTKQHLWRVDKRSLADQCILYANEIGKETEQDTKNSGDTYNINAEHVSLGDKAQHAGRDITTPEAEKGNKPRYKKIWAIVSSFIFILAALTAIVCNLDKIKKMFKGKIEEHVPTQKIKDIDIEQKGETLSNVTGIDMSNNPHDTEIGKVTIHQEGDNLRNVTGMKMEFDANSGEVELKDKLEIKQKGQHGQSSVTFNADQPGVKIIFNKKSENSNQ